MCPSLDFYCLFINGAKVGTSVQFAKKDRVYAIFHVQSAKPLKDMTGLYPEHTLRVPDFDSRDVSTIQALITPELLASLGVASPKETTTSAPFASDSSEPSPCYKCNRWNRKYREFYQLKVDAEKKQKIADQARIEAEEASLKVVEALKSIMNSMKETRVVENA